MSSYNIDDEVLNELLEVWKQKNTITEQKVSKMQNQILQDSTKLNYKWWIDFFEKMSLQVIKDLNKFNFDKDFFQIIYANNYNL